MKTHFYNFGLVWANDNTALIPEFWANEALMRLRSNMVVANRVYTDYSPMVARFGETVHAHRPGSYVSKRKTDADEVTDQDATVSQIDVKLDQHLHISIVLKDGEESKTFKDLASYHLGPIIDAHSEMVDRIILGQYSQFLGNCYGKLGGLSSSTAREYILGTRGVMNKRKAPMMGRDLFWNPDSETQALSLPDFTNANTVGDDGTRLREASMGRLLGFNHFMGQNMATVAAGTIDVGETGAVNNAGGYPVGTTSLTVDGFSGTLSPNQWITIDGVPYRVVTATGVATTAITIPAPGLQYAVANDAVINSYGAGAVDLVAGYASGYSKEIVYDTFTLDPAVGQLVTFGTDPTSPIYTIVAVDTTAKTITLDRPLEAALANDDEIYGGPAGAFNMALHRNAIAIVSRPLAMPQAGTGALSAVASDNGIGMRATITYDGKAQGHRITIDFLFGIKVLDTNLGAVLLG